MQAVNDNYPLKRMNIRKVRNLKTYIRIETKYNMSLGDHDALTGGTKDSYFFFVWTYRSNFLNWKELELLK